MSDDYVKKNINKINLDAGTIFEANTWNGKLKKIPKDIIDREGGEAYTQELKRRSGKSKSDLYWDPKTGEVYAVPKKKGPKPEEPELLDQIPTRGGKNE